MRARLGADAGDRHGRVWSGAGRRAGSRVASSGRTYGPIFTHGSVEVLNRAYRDSGIALSETAHAGTGPRKQSWAGALIVAPPSAQGTSWTRKFGAVSTALASGWMRTRGTRRRRAVDRGFVLSDHADWPGLLGAIAETGAQRILITHGPTATLARWLMSRGYDAHALSTEFPGEQDEPAREAGPDEEDAGAAVRH